MASTGAGGIVGFAPEVTRGTRVAPTKFVPWISETMSLTKERMVAPHITGVELAAHEDSVNGGAISAGGEIQMLMNHAGQELLWEHMLGTVGSTTGTDPYTRVFTPGNLDAKSLSVAISRPDSGGTTRQFDYVGQKVASWSIDCAVGEYAKLNVTFLGMNEATGNSVPTPSFSTGGKLPYKYIYGGVTVDGDPLKVTNLSLAGDNKVGARPFLGQATSDNPLSSDLRDYTGSITPEFTSLDQYTNFTSGATMELVVTFAQGADSITITEQIKYDGAAPNMSGRGIISQPLPFTAFYTDAAPPISVELVNALA